MTDNLKRQYPMQHCSYLNSLTTIESGEIFLVFSANDCDKTLVTPVEQHVPNATIIPITTQRVPISLAVSLHTSSCAQVCNKVNSSTSFLGIPIYPLIIGRRSCGRLPQSTRLGVLRTVVALTATLTRTRQSSDTLVLYLIHPASPCHSTLRCA
jgi:hypothetical protein